MANSGQDGLIRVQAGTKTGVGSISIENDLVSLSPNSDIVLQAGTTGGSVSIQDGRQVRAADRVILEAAGGTVSAGGTGTLIAADNVTLLALTDALLNLKANVLSGEFGNLQNISRQEILSFVVRTDSNLTRSKPKAVPCSLRSPM